MKYTNQTKPKFFVLIAIKSLLFKIVFEEYNGTYNLEIHVFADGKCESSAGRIVTDGIGWKPSSEAGRAGDPVKFEDSYLWKYLFFLN